MLRKVTLATLFGNVGFLWVALHPPSVDVAPAPPRRDVRPDVEVGSPDGGDMGRTPVDATARAQLAAHVLGSATALYGSTVGPLSTIPTEALAWRVLLRHPDGLRIFRELSEHPSVATQLYALAALYSLDPPFYRAAAAELRASRDTIEVVIGCLVVSQPISQVIREMDRGNWTWQLAQ